MVSTILSQSLSLSGLLRCHLWPLLHSKKFCLSYPQLSYSVPVQRIKRDILGLWASLWWKNIWHFPSWLTLDAEDSLVGEDDAHSCSVLHLSTAHSNSFWGLSGNINGNTNLIRNRILYKINKQLHWIHYSIKLWDHAINRMMLDESNTHWYCRRRRHNSTTLILYVQCNCLLI